MRLRGPLGRQVADELGQDFTLLAFGADEACIGAIERAATSLGVPLKTVTDTWSGGREAYEARMILVRPDQYVAWIGDAAPVLIWMSGTDKLCTWFNKSWLDFVGRTMAQELANIPAAPRADQDVIRPLTKPMYALVSV